MRFYPALLWRRGPLWHAQVLDFKDLGGCGKTRPEALEVAQKALQERVDGVTDHQELPHPSHWLVASAKMVATEAHGLELIKIDTKLENESRGEIK